MSLKSKFVLINKTKGVEITWVEPSCLHFSGKELLLMTYLENTGFES